MLDSTLKTQLQAYLERLVDPIELVASLDDSAKSAEMHRLLQDIAGLSSKISVAEGDADRRPSFAIHCNGEPSGVTFAGIPLGHEFTSLVLALLQASGYAPRVSDEVIARIRALDVDLDFETYVSLSCQNCPDVVQALNLMAVLNPRIRHTMIDGAVFEAEVTAKNILSVPTIYLNGEHFGQGRMSVEEVLARVDTGAAERDAAALAARDAYDVLVVGGGPAAAAAAVYAARKGVRTGLVAERFGGQVLDTLAIENFISVPRTEGPKLVAAMEQHVADYAVDVMNHQRATGLVPARQSDDGLVHIQLANGASLRSKSVILSTGARWREMNVPGEREYRGKGVAYCPHCDGPLFKGKRVAVIGGGNSGIEAAIDLAGIVEHVTVLEFDDKLRADAVLQKKLASLSNVDVIVSAQTTEVTGDGQKMTGLVYTDRTSGAVHSLELAGVFVQIGLLPNTDWLRDTLALTARGEIEVDARGQTSLPGVFAAGDATTAPFKQIIIAMGSGATAALGAFDHLMRNSVAERVEEAA
ncbi:MAG TPA: alkyl hydroperoxide reductase subunit F [Spongiibacteraceae bacterium]|jgi:alkyl hydroperoxide reductase subunit F|nr:alkyl hydroperoxide reductase subunit F [Spongiibacteraceae bacterium]HUH38232.1 alkyl hydroperoxide reductase subunit F [Spongiibacteraceae bacterium]